MRGADPNFGQSPLADQSWKQRLRPFPYTPETGALGNGMEEGLTLMGTSGFGLARSADLAAAAANVERQAALGMFRPGSMATGAVRDWYRGALADIPKRVDFSLSIRDRALEAFRLRNEIKLQARMMMADGELAGALPPPRTLSNVVKHAYDKGYRGDDVWNYIYNSAQRSDPATDAIFNLGSQ
jgi:hypothetical protein